MSSQPGASFEEARQQLIEAFFAPLLLSSADVRLLVWATHNMSGADIEMLADAAKRFRVLHGNSDDAPADDEELSDQVRGSKTLEALRRQAALNAGLFEAGRAAALLAAPEGLNKALTKAGLNQAERGSILGLSQSAVSRLGKRAEREDREGV